VEEDFGDKLQVRRIRAKGEKGESTMHSERHGYSHLGGRKVNRRNQTQTERLVWEGESEIGWVQMLKPLLKAQTSGNSRNRRVPMKNLLLCKGVEGRMRRMNLFAYFGFEGTLGRRIIK